MDLLLERATRRQEDGALQRLGGDLRLQHVVLRAEVDSAHRHLQLLVASQHDERGGRRARVLDDRVVALVVGQRQVEQHDVGLVHLDHLQRRLERHCGAHDEAHVLGALEHHLDLVRVCLVVFDEQNVNLWPPHQEEDSTACSNQYD